MNNHKMMRDEIEKAAAPLEDEIKQTKSDFSIGLDDLKIQLQKLKEKISSIEC